MHQAQWSPERPLPPPVSLASQSHHEKPPEVTCTSRGNPEFPASTRESPRETSFNTSRGQIPLPWLGSNDALPLATRMETRLPWRPTRGSLTSPSYLVRNRTLGPPLENNPEIPPSSREAGLAAAHEGAQEVDDLDAGFEDAAGRQGLRKGRWCGEDIAKFQRQQGRTAIQRLAEDVEHAPEARRVHRNVERRPPVEHRHAAIQPGYGVQSNRPDQGRIQMLADDQHVATVVVAHIEGLPEGRQVIATHIDDRTLRRLDPADGVCILSHLEIGRA